MSQTLPPDNHDPIASLPYEAAVARLEEIVQQFETGTLQVDQLTDLLREAHALIPLCNSRLRAIEGEVTQILDDNEQK